MDTVQEVILQILNTYCKGSLTPDTDLFESGLTSMNAVDVLVALERHYEITFDDEELDLRKVRTVKNLTNLVKSKLKEE